jgi:opacity protein-like surface antigen/outer membrane protease
VYNKFAWNRLFGLAAIAFFLPANAQAQSPQTWNWTGYYAGVHIGNAANTNEWKNATGGLGGANGFSGGFTAGGLISGFQFGYNYQVDRTVFGIEGDVSFGDIEGGARCGVAVYVCDAKIDALGTLTPRLGYTFGKLLVFGKAGAAWAHERVNLEPTPGNGQADSDNGKAWRFGYTLGAGVEYAFSPALSATAEYNFIEFNNGSVNTTDPNGGPSSIRIGQQIHLVKLGLNYKLGEKSPFEYPFGRPGELPAWSWTGFYGGLHAGGGWGMTDWKSADGTLAAASTFGFPGSGQANGSIAGGQIGYNYQVGTWVIGGELSASWSNLDGYARCANTTVGPANYVCHSRIDALGTASARLGHTFGNLLVYSLAGFAVAHEKHDAYQTFGTDLFSGSSTRTGYVLGSGLEYAITPAWSAKLEYNYIDLGSKTVALDDGAGNRSNVLIGQSLQIIKMGVNYKFGADPYAPGQGVFASALIGKAPIISSGWAIEAGLRYAFSNGKAQGDLYSPNPSNQLNSRLIYGGADGHAAETFFRFDHDNRVFVKGNFGIGSLVNGKLFDEDMPPFEPNYSNTLHSMKDGALRYGSLDIGYNLLSSPAGKLGPYIGYRYFHQLYRGFGCDQVAAAGGQCVPPPGADRLTLSETETWRGAAIGLNAQLVLSPRWRLEADAAYLPYVDRSGVDNHWARASINPGPETGNGWGTQVEAILTYAVSERLSVGLGGRYWYFASNSGASQFPNNAVASPLKFTSERYGGFLQASYKIGDVKRLDREYREPEAQVDWTGFYVGGHLGAGKGRADWSDPFPAPATGDRVPLGGALGGAQIGFNKQFGKIVLGAEFSGSAARIEGSETCFAGVVPATDAGLNCENRIGPMAAFTGRAGYAFDRSLIYAKFGGVVVREKYSLNANVIPGSGVSTVNATNWGWTIGAGIEHALNARWSVVAEYKYVDFGSRDVGFVVPAAIAAAATTAVTSRVHLMTLGANYHFDPMTK